MPTVKCPHCAANLNAPTEYKGRKVKCTSCGKSFMLRLPSYSAAVGGSTMDLFDEELAKEISEAPPTSVKMTLAVDSWRAAIYQQVADERFDRDFSAFAQAALDALAEELGYPRAQSEKPKSA
jgi:hypothetical protein